MKRLALHFEVDANQPTGDYSGPSELSVPYNYKFQSQFQIQERSSMSKKLAVTSTLAAVTIATAAMVASVDPSQAQSSASDSANATAHIIEALTMSRLRHLDFGDLIPSGAAGTVTVTPGTGPVGTAGRTTSGGVTAVASAGFTDAAFEVKGEPSKNVVFSIDTVPATIDSGGDTMTIRDWQFAPSNPQPLDVTTGLVVFTVGATIDVAASQPTGAYSETFHVTAAYE
jgi:hypothetical protein